MSYDTACILCSAYISADCQILNDRGFVIKSPKQAALLTNTVKLGNLKAGSVKSSLIAADRSPGAKGFGAYRGKIDVSRELSVDRIFFVRVYLVGKPSKVVCRSNEVIGLPIDRRRGRRRAYRDRAKHNECCYEHQCRDQHTCCLKYCVLFLHNCSPFYLT